jgi:hypothetical protein
MAARIAWAMAVPARLRQPLPEAAAMAGAALGERLSGRLTWAIGAAENRREGVGLVCHRPNSTGGRGDGAAAFPERALGGVACSAAAHPWLTTVTWPKLLRPWATTGWW